MRIKNEFIIIPFLLTAGVVISGLSALWLYEMEEKVLLSTLQKEVDARAASLHRELSVNFEALKSLGILFDNEPLPNYPEFKKQAQRILQRHPNIQALEWIPRIPHASKAIFLEKIRAYFPTFQIVERLEQGVMGPVTPRPEYFPVYFVEPYKGNEKALGFDPASSPTRRVTLEQSRATGLPLATAGITLVQASGEQKGFLAFLPVYKDLPTTGKERWNNLKGFVLAVYRANDIFQQSALDERSSDIHMIMADSTDAETELLSENYSDGHNPNHTITYQKDLPEMFGRQWSILAHPSEHYLSNRISPLSYVVLLFGILLTSLIVAYAGFLIRKNTTVKQLVKEKTKDLIEAHKKAEDYQIKMIEMNKMASLGEMSAGIGHELSQPLGTILLKCQLMAMAIEKKSYDKCISMLADIKSQTIRAKDIMDSLRIISRNGKRKDQSNVLLKDIIYQAGLLFRDEFYMNKITLKQEHADGILIFVSPVQMGQVVTNLLGNARDALENSPQKIITIRSFIDNNRAVLEIEDTGSGIPEEHQSKIFEPFFTSKPVGKGTGLGLSMCYSMIQENGGDIQFRTELNKGTCFTLSFPLSKD